MKVEKCCCCIPLPTGVKILGVLEILNWLINIWTGNMFNVCLFWLTPLAFILMLARDKKLHR